MCIHVLNDHKSEISSTQFEFTGDFCATGSIDRFISLKNKKKINKLKINFFTLYIFSWSYFNLLWLKLVFFFEIELVKFGT
jgi:hypothetical protein